jgi:hypothetical protein
MRQTLFLCTLKCCKLVSQWTWLAQLSDRQCLRLGHYFFSKSIPVGCSPVILHCICRFLLHLAHVVGHFLSCMELGWLTETHYVVWRLLYVCCRKVSFQLQWKIPLQQCVILYSVCIWWMVNIQGARYLNKFREKLKKVLSNIFHCTQ